MSHVPLQTEQCIFSLTDRQTADACVTTVALLTKSSRAKNPKHFFSTIQKRRCIWPRGNNNHNLKEIQQWVRDYACMRTTDILIPISCLTVLLIYSQAELKNHGLFLKSLFQRQRTQQYSNITSKIKEEHNK